MKKKKSVLTKELKAWGHDTKNMSLMKQRKLLDKILKKASKKSKNSKSNTNENSNNKESVDPLAFMEDNNLDIKQNETNSNDMELKDDSQLQTKKDSKKRINFNNKKLDKKSSNKNKNELDLEFGKVLKTEIKKMDDEEYFIRHGHKRKRLDKDFVSDFKRLKQLKAWNKNLINKGINNGKVYCDDILSENVIKRIRGEKLDNDYKVLKKKIDKKRRLKRKSQREWNKRIKMKKYGMERKAERRAANMKEYIDKKIKKRIGIRLTDEQLLAKYD